MTYQNFRLSQIGTYLCAMRNVISFLGPYLENLLEQICLETSSELIANADIRRVAGLFCNRAPASICLEALFRYSPDLASALYEFVSCCSVSPDADGLRLISLVAQIEYPDMSLWVQYIRWMSDHARRTAPRMPRPKARHRKYVVMMRIAHPFPVSGLCQCQSWQGASLSIEYL